jgi:hypothetical protein
LGDASGDSSKHWRGTARVHRYVAAGNKDIAQAVGDETPPPERAIFGCDDDLVEGSAPLWPEIDGVCSACSIKEKSTIVFADVCTCQKADGSYSISACHTHCIAGKIIGKGGPKWSHNINVFSDAFRSKERCPFAHYFEENFDLFMEVAPEDAQRAPKKRRFRGADPDVKELARLSIARDGRGPVNMMKSDFVDLISVNKSR